MHYMYVNYLFYYKSFEKALSFLSSVTLCNVSGVIT